MKLKSLDEVYKTTVVEKDEHKLSKEYKKLSPKNAESSRFHLQNHGC